MSVTRLKTSGQLCVAITMLALGVAVSACADDSNEFLNAGVPVNETENPTTGQATADQSETEKLGFVIWQEERSDLRNYASFQYANAKTQGLSPEAAIVADALIASMVDPVVEMLVRENEEECLPGESPCGSIRLTLTPQPCPESYLCLLQEVSGSRVGLATSWSETRSVVLDAKTGRAVTLPEYIAPLAVPEFEKRLTNGVEEWHQREDLSAESVSGVSLREIAAWLPTPRGVTAWFDRYVIAPGFAGTVSIFVSTQEQSPEETQDVQPATTSPASGARVLEGSEKKRLLSDIGLEGPAKCWIIDRSLSDPNWALVSPSAECGPSSGHSSVYKFTSGVWEYQFYDLEMDGCERFNVPDSVKSDFSPYIC